MKLSNLKPRLGTLPARMRTATDIPTPRETMPYRTYRWQKLRERVLLRDMYQCRMCGRIQIGKGETIIDHIKPHRGDLALFWDETNLQVLCKSPCHEQHKKHIEAAMPAGVWW